MHGGTMSGGGGGGGSTYKDPLEVISSLGLRGGGTPYNYSVDVYNFHS